MLENVSYKEKELLLRVSAGDKHAFIQLHNHYFDKIYYAALSFLKSPDLAMDTLQDVFLKLWQKRALLCTIENFGAYLMVMVRNELINVLQRQNRRSEVYQGYKLLIPENFMLADTQLEYKELNLIITNAVSTLSPQQQLIYQLTREEGLSHAVVAERLGLSTKTIANSITLILNHLRIHILKHKKAYLWILAFFIP